MHFRDLKSVGLLFIAAGCAVTWVGSKTLIKRAKKEKDAFLVFVIPYK